MKHPIRKLAIWKTLQLPDGDKVVIAGEYANNWGQSKINASET